MSTEIEDVGYNGLIGSMDHLTLEISDSSHHDNPFLYKIFTNDLLYSLIYDASSAKSLVCLLRTCQAVRATVQEYIQRVFRIDPLLSRYFTDVLAFRYLQACTGTVISGSTALQFFDRSFYPGSDLDLYVPMTGRVRVGRFLLKEGYKFVPNPIQKSTPNFDDAIMGRRVLTNKAFYGDFKGIASVFNFEKQPDHGKRLRVQIIVAVRSPMEVILCFHSSMLRWYISSHTATYSLHIL